MRPLDNIEKLIKKLRYKASDEAHNRVLGNVLQALDKSQKTTSAPKPNIWRIIMKSKITKLAATAVIIIAIVLSITFLDKSVTPAYALEQTIQANSVLRYLHTKYFHGERDDVAKECWFEFDDSGRTKNLRINWSEWFGGGYVIVWNENETKSWNPKQKFLKLFNDEIYTSRVHNMMESEDPKLIIEHLYDQEAEGQVKIEIDESGNKAEPIVVTATYLPESPKYGDRKILFIDRGTKLTTRMELYVLKEDEYTYYGVIEYFDYNVPIDAQMFNLADEIPNDAYQIDTRTQDIGLVQEALADEEIAVKVVREFLEALIAEDYAKAGQVAGLPPGKIQKGWGDKKITHIVSIGEPFRLDKPSKIHPKRLCVRYTIKVEKKGQIVQQLRESRVAPIIGRRDRWERQGDRLLNEF